MPTYPWLLGPSGQLYFWDIPLHHSKRPHVNVVCLWLSNNSTYLASLRCLLVACKTKKKLSPLKHQVHKLKILLYRDQFDMDLFWSSSPQYLISKWQMFIEFHLHSTERDVLLSSFCFLDNPLLLYWFINRLPSFWFTVGYIPPLPFLTSPSSGLFHYS